MRKIKGFVVLITCMFMIVQSMLAVNAGVHAESNRTVSSATNFQTNKVNVFSTAEELSAKQAVLNHSLKDNRVVNTVLIDPNNAPVIYVSNTGNGSGDDEADPASFEYALAKAGDGYILRFIDGVTRRTVLTVDKQLVFEGIDGTVDEGLNLNGDLILNAGVVWRNMKLTLNGDGEGSGTIFVNDNVVFDGLSTQISTVQNDERPRLVIGKNADGKIAQVDIKNNDDTRFYNAVFAGDGKLTISSGVKIDQGILNEGNTAEVINASNRVDSFENTNGGNLHLTITDANLTDAIVKDVTEIHLMDQSTVSLNEVTGKPSVWVEQGSVLMAKDIHLSAKEVKGPGKISFSHIGSLNADKLADDPEITFTKGDLNYTAVDGKVFVKTSEGEARVTLTDLSQVLQKNTQGEYVYTATYRIYHEFEKFEDADPELPIAVKNLLPEDKENLKKEPEAPAAITESVEDAANSGAWQFKGWELDSQQSIGKIKVYIGKWDFVAKNPANPTMPILPKHKVFYVYTGDIPAGRTVATPVLEVEEGKEIMIEADEKAVTVNGVDGFYNLVWDRSQLKMGDRDITVIGTWSFTANSNDSENEPNLPNPPQALKGEWLLNSVGYWYRHQDGSYTRSNWEYINGRWYYFNESGYMLTGWQQLGGTWYYLGASNDGSMKTGWIFYNNRYYYLDESGAMATGWKFINNQWYYMSSNGDMLFDWQQIGGTWYYLGAAGDGSMKTGWIFYNNRYYYLDESGAMATGWKFINNQWYYMSSNGDMLFDWQQIGGTWYYLGASNDGSMKTGAQNIRGTVYYFAENGAWIQ